MSLFIALQFEPSEPSNNKLEKGLLMHRRYYKEQNAIGAVSSESLFAPVLSEQREQDVSLPQGGSLPSVDLTSSRCRNVIVIHETDGRKYFEALVQLQRDGVLNSVNFIGASVVWRFGHILFRERKSIGFAIRRCLENLKFRLSFWSIRDHTIILGVGPWDLRFLLYAPLRHKNRFIYNTSWPYWTGSNVPRKLGFLTPLLRQRWLSILGQNDAEVVAVTSDAAQSVATALKFQKQPKVISHVVSEVFFHKRARHSIPFRLLFIGDLLERKGFSYLPQILDELRDEPVVLDIVGDGPLRSIAVELANRAGCRWHGRVTDREKLAEIVANCQVFVSPAVKSERWEELFGMSIVEAMAVGLPCIVSDHSGPRSILTSGRDGVLVPDGDIKQIAKWIRTFLRDPDVWTTMSHEALITAKSYSLRAISNKWRDLLFMNSKQRNGN